ncbi:transcriptional regulator [Cryobacterium zongtaii]|uniref:Transcriptional regulator n=1 Tax=Cryobacterium zongtaii TaxID=1259217 RepID=A0A2S3ZLD3_9MICO|nr:WYL domain-containing protein [Cryobacterium zongtaii]POH69139.1 transcriptional regulator [Cryobacterium zongtaii]
MWETSERLLRLLALLQHSRIWSADQLAEEIAVTERTVRRDVARLRQLGYPVTTIHGAGGGYELEPGAALPPLMFDEKEAVATVLALQDAAATESPAGASDALSALSKIHGAMPQRLRAAVAALTNHSSSLELGSLIGAPAAVLSIDTLLLLAKACRSGRQVTCVYQKHAGQSSPRRLEPLHLVHTMNRWYLVAFAADSGGWRTFRVDRITEPVVTPTPNYPREPPSELDSFVTQQIAAGVRQVTGTVRVHAPISEVAAWISPAWGTIVPETTTASLITAGADSYSAMARWLLLLDRPLEVLHPPELRSAFAAISATARQIADNE